MDDITNKIGQRNRAIKQVNIVLWNNNITRRTKHIVYHSIVESITCGAEQWELTQRQTERQVAVEIWRRDCGICRLDHVRNSKIRKIMNVESAIINTVVRKRLLCYQL